MTSAATPDSQLPTLNSQLSLFNPDMSDSAIVPEFKPDRDTTLIQTRIRRFVWKIAIATLLLMAVGSATRVMNAGLACPIGPYVTGNSYPANR